MKFVSPVRHDQQNLERLCYGLTQDWNFVIENELGMMKLCTSEKKY
jgi:hypothetical protein